MSVESVNHLRKLRKKLREIEKLELKPSVNQEEQDKILMKRRFQQQIQSILASQPVEEATPDRRHDRLDSVVEERGRVPVEEPEEGQDQIDPEVPEIPVPDPQVVEIGNLNGAEVHPTELPQSPSNKKRRSSIDSNELSAKSPKSSTSFDSGFSQCTAEDIAPPNEFTSIEDGHSNHIASSSNQKNTPESVPGKSSTKKKIKKSATKHLAFDPRFLSGAKLDGHNDLVFAVDCLDDVIVSGGRDTMVKLWDRRSGHERKTLLGHTSVITSVRLLRLQSSITFNEESTVESGTVLVISAAFDCCVKVWDSSSGDMVQDIYTFNSIAAMDLIVSPDKLMVVCGTDGGKLQLWDLCTSAELTSVPGAHLESINALKVFQEDDSWVVASGCADGNVQTWKLAASPFALLGPYSVASDPLGNIRTIEVDSRDSSILYVGDDGSNIKVISRKNGGYSKLRNHSSDFGYTDCISQVGNLLFATSYDLDSGKPCINVFEAIDPTTLLGPASTLVGLYCSSIQLEDEDFTGRILSMKVNAEQAGNYSITTGGKSVFSIETCPENARGSLLKIENVQLKPMAVSAADSDVNGMTTTDDESISDASSDDCQNRKLPQQKWPLVVASTSWSSWCSIV